MYTYQLVEYEPSSGEYLRDHAYPHFPTMRECLLHFQQTPLWIIQEEMKLHNIEKILILLNKRKEETELILKTWVLMKITPGSLHYFHPLLEE